VLDLPLERPVVEEGSAYGAALLAGVAVGSFGDLHEAVGACVRTSRRIEPEPSWREEYEAGYARFRALYPALRPLE
jgi:xylulokinase